MATSAWPPPATGSADLDTCPRCKERIEPGRRICPVCATRLHPTTGAFPCPSCGHPAGATDSYCSACGSAILRGQRPAAACTRCGALYLGEGTCRTCGGNVRAVAGNDLSQHGHIRRRRAENSGDPVAFGRRLGAYLLDGILLFVVSFILLLAMEGVPAEGESYSTLSQGIVSLLGVIYFIGFWAHGTSVGKLVVGIRIVRLTDGEAPGLGLAIVRYLVSVISLLCFLLGYLWMIWDGEKRTWHDKASSTAVVYI